LGAACRKLKETCTKISWPIVKQRFIFYNKDILTKYPGLPWFIPEWLGGVGLPVDSSDEISRTNRLCASIIKMKMSRDSKWQPAKPKDMAQWLLHQAVEKELKPYGIKTAPFRRMCFGHEDVNIQDAYSEAYKILTCNILQK
jgi:hypothetical protein